MSKRKIFEIKAPQANSDYKICSYSEKLWELKFPSHIACSYVLRRTNVMFIRKTMEPESEL
jgi:hypothetical protein